MRSAQSSYEDGDGLWSAAEVSDVHATDDNIYHVEDLEQVFPNLCFCHDSSEK